jgi:hypothetical protein
MKSNPIFVAAAGFAMVGACSVTTKEDNAVDDNGAAAATTEDSVPGTNEAGAQTGPVDTLGNQLNQLNADSEAAGNDASDQQ